MADLLHATATSTPVAVPCQLHSVVLTAGSDTATVVVRSNGASGTVLLKLSAVANTSAVWSSGAPNGTLVGVNLHITVTGTSPTVDVEVSR